MSLKSRRRQRKWERFKLDLYGALQVAFIAEGLAGFIMMGGAEETAKMVPNTPLAQTIVFAILGVMMLLNAVIGFKFFRGLEILEIRKRKEKRARERQLRMGA